MIWLNPGWEGRNQLIALSDQELIAIRLERQSKSLKFIFQESTYSTLELSSVAASYVDRLEPYSVVLQAYFDPSSKFRELEPELYKHLLEAAGAKEATEYSIFTIEAAIGFEAFFLCKEATYTGGLSREAAFNWLAQDAGS